MVVVEWELWVLLVETVAPILPVIGVGPDEQRQTRQQSYIQFEVRVQLSFHKVRWMVHVVAICNVAVL